MSFSLRLQDCVASLDAELKGANAIVSGVSIDTRTLQVGDMYVAIVGERFNGHDFVQAAEDAGALAIVCSEDVSSGLPCLKVADTTAALGQLGKLWASQFAIPTIAVTGSNGKTTVKQIVTGILQQLGPVLSTKGNFNNEIGVPLTLLAMRREHLYAVIEMGASRAGDIATLVALVNSDVAVVTNIGTAHLEGFGSVEGIASAKSEIYSGLKSDGYAVINADDRFADVMRNASTHCQVRQFGRGEDASVRGLPGKELVIETMRSSFSPQFALEGEHNIMNVLAAVAAVQCLDVEVDVITAGLATIKPVPGRLERKQGLNGSVIIDDSYNASPDSVRSAIAVLAGYSGKRYLVLGDMAELGPTSSRLHKDIGKYAKAQGIDGLWTVGVLSAFIQHAYKLSGDEHYSIQGDHFSDQDALVKDINQQLDNDVTVLVKGSRSTVMENVVNQLLAISPVELLS